MRGACYFTGPLCLGGDSSCRLFRCCCYFHYRSIPVWTRHSMRRCSPPGSCSNWSPWCPWCCCSSSLFPGSRWFLWHWFRMFPACCFVQLRASLRAQALPQSRLLQVSCCCPFPLSKGQRRSRRAVPGNPRRVPRKSATCAMTKFQAASEACENSSACNWAEGIAGLKRNPCISLQPRRCKISRCFTVSTPSAVVAIRQADAMLTTA